MATRSTISLVTDKGIKSIYAHWDGYPSHNGKILLENYETFDKIISLLSHGGVSVLAETPEISKFYHRDSGEKLQISSFATFDTFIKRGNLQEWNYIFIPNNTENIPFNENPEGKWYAICESMRLVPLELLVNLDDSEAYEVLENKKHHVTFKGTLSN